MTDFETGFLVSVGIFACLAVACGVPKEERMPAVAGFLMLCIVFWLAIRGALTLFK
jgi:hypothetical protein